MHASCGQLFSGSISANRKSTANKKNVVSHVSQLEHRIYSAERFGRSYSYVQSATEFDESVAKMNTLLGEIGRCASHCRRVLDMS